MPASAKYHAPLLVLLNHRSSTGVHGPLTTAMGLPGMGVHTWDPSTQKPERERGGPQIQGQRGLHSESLSKGGGGGGQITVTRKLDKNKNRWRTSGKLGCKQVR